MRDGEYFDKPGLWAPERYEESHQMERFRTCAQLIPPGSARLLDVGTGNGAFLAYVGRERPEISAVGLERSAAAIARAVTSAPIMEGSGERLPFADGSVDVVSALEVIEHFPQRVYETCLREMERVAARNILISVPYRERRMSVRCPYCGCTFNPHYHMRSFDEGVMRGLFQDFECAEIRTVDAPDVPLGAVIKPLYRWARGRLGFFPWGAVCPQCGYESTQPSERGTHVENGGGAAPENAEGAAEVDRTHRRTARAIRLGRAVKEALPSVRRPLWLVALYRRRG
jgi:SAM-dependent methyltransferase